MVVTLYTSQGDPFTVDDEDVPLVSRFTWSLVQASRRQPAFLSTHAHLPGHALGTLPLRLLLAGTPPGHNHQTYCLNGNPLCMEKSNLTWLDSPTLRHWTSKPKNPYGYRGVTRIPKTKPWQIALAGYKGPRTFTTIEEAARAYDQAAKARFGPWARLNFPGPDDLMPMSLGFPSANGPLRGAEGELLQVDPEYLPVLSRHRWEWGPNGYWTSIGWLRVPLTYLILGKPGSGGHPLIDWQDGDMCHCTLSNLSWRYLGKSPYRGVHPEGSRWSAVIECSGQTHYLGTMETPEEAAKAYDQVARTLLGPRARLNFPQHHECPAVKPCHSSREFDELKRT